MSPFFDEEPVFRPIITAGPAAKRRCAQPLSSLRVKHGQVCWQGYNPADLLYAGSGNFHRKRCTRGRPGSTLFLTGFFLGRPVTPSGCLRRDVLSLALPRSTSTRN